MIEYIESLPISELSPADYNPRRIDEDSFAMLRESLSKFGVIKPVLLNGNGTLIAGHQRVKAILANGGTHVPALRTKLVGLKEEARLNLYHNSVETGNSTIDIDGDLPDGYSFIDPSRVRVIERAKPGIVSEICRLILKCGEWGSIVVSSSGRVLCNSDYALAAHLTRKKVLAYVVPAEESEAIEAYFGRDYGRYNYDTLPVHNINQKKCQMHRLRNGDTDGKANASSCYENWVIPVITKEMRGIDFGEGYGDYRSKLQKEGYNIIGYEPFQTVRGSSVIDLPTIRVAIKRVEEAVKTGGLFDYVVLDSVINSVTSLDYEHYVLATCASLVRSGGEFFTTTRRFHDKQNSAKNRCTRKQRSIEFLDSDGFSTIFRDGLWTKQRFHTNESFKETLERYFDYVEIRPFQLKSRYQIAAYCKDPKPMPESVAALALNTEFNLDYNGVKLNVHGGLVEAVLLQLKENDRISSPKS